MGECEDLLSAIPGHRLEMCYLHWPLTLYKQEKVHLFHKPWPAAQRAPVVWWDHSTRCRRCRSPSSSQRAQSAQSDPSCFCACSQSRAQVVDTHFLVQLKLKSRTLMIWQAFNIIECWAVHKYQNKFSKSRYWRRTTQVPYHLASGLMICGWSMMNVGLIHVTSRKSPTNCRNKTLMNNLERIYIIKKDKHINSDCEG